MKRILAIALFYSVTAFSATPSEILLNGVTLCKSPNNPLDAIKVLGGDYFTEATVEDDVVTALIIRNPQIYNTSIMAPARVMGRLKFHMGYYSEVGKPGQVLKCTLETEKSAF